MSVTFTFAYPATDPEYGLVMVHGVDCRHVCPQTPMCEEAQEFYGLCAHADDAQDACGCRDREVNLSNVNAGAVLTVLGLPFDPECIAGETDPDDLTGRCLTSAVGLDDTGIPATVDAAPGRATMVECGLPAGYYTRTLDRLAALAAEAKTRGCLIGWS